MAVAGSICVPATFWALLHLEKDENISFSTRSVGEELNWQTK